MAFEVEHGLELARGIIAAVGLPKSGWDRIVIEIEIDKAPQIYVRGFLDKAATPGIVTAVRDVAVSANGDVRATPLVVRNATGAIEVIEDPLPQTPFEAAAHG